MATHSPAIIVRSPQFLQPAAPAWLAISVEAGVREAAAGMASIWRPTRSAKAENSAKRRLRARILMASNMRPAVSMFNPPGHRMK